MTYEIILLLILTALAMALFTWDKIEADVVALGLMLVLAMTGLLPRERVFEGFGSDTVMMILGLLILNASLQRNGVMEIVGRSIVRFTGNNTSGLLAVILVAASGLSAFMSNTAAAAFFLPIVLGITRKAGLSASQFLLPLAFACILTSSVSLISTSTNLVINGLMQQAKMPEMGMFELAPVGVPIAVAGLLYIFFVGRSLLPKATPEESAPTLYSAWPYLTEVVVLPDSPLVGKTLDESGLGRDFDLMVVRVLRNKRDYYSPNTKLMLLAGDILLVEALREDLLKIKETQGIEIRANLKFADVANQMKDLQFVEVILMPGSRLVGRTLGRFRFRERFQLQVLGINRSGESIQRKISEVTLHAGDVLLIEGRAEQIRLLEEDPKFRIISQQEQSQFNPKNAVLAIGIFVAAILLASFKVLTLPVAILSGVVVAFITGCISPREAYREVEWKAVILIGSMLSLGVAMEHTGTARFLASLLVTWTEGGNPYWLLGGFFLLTIMLTQPMSNQAAAVLVIPVAIQTALAAGLNPRPFCMMIAVAASCSYLTPLEPACLMVYGPGRYKFVDFIRVGTPLTLIIFVIALWLVPLIWPLR